LVVVCIAAIAVVGCDSERLSKLEKENQQPPTPPSVQTQNNAVQAPTQTRPLPLPTATEVFTLRSQCADLAERRAAARARALATEVLQWSYYNPTTNRCFVEFSEGYKSSFFDGSVSDRTLVDGQTGDLIAYTLVEFKNNGVSREGYIVDFDSLAFHNGEARYEQAAKFIDQSMNRRR
jgi:hypothetical protein